MKVSVNDFKEERECDFKGEHYSVRDNGAVKRHSRKGKRRRLLDDSWSFGMKDNKSGYLFFSGIGVHRIVAAAFLEKPDYENYVVDHIDTNRCNNHPKNLRYCTRLENALNNPITRAKIIALCGSIERFIENPSILRSYSANDEKKYGWMRTVTPEEAKASFANWQAWASRHHDDPNYVPKPLDDSIFSVRTRSGRKLSPSDFEFGIFPPPEEAPASPSMGSSESIEMPYIPHWPDYLAEEKPLELHPVKQEEEPPQPQFLPSATPNCLQSWSTLTEFPCAPQDELSVESYFRQLKQGAVYSRNQYGEQTVIKAELSTDKQRCFLMSYDPKAVKHWYVSEIYIENGNYIHNLYSSAFDEEGAEYHFCTVSGKEWDKPVPESTYAD